MEEKKSQVNECGWFNRSIISTNTIKARLIGEDYLFQGERELETEKVKQYGLNSVIHFYILSQLYLISYKFLLKNCNILAKILSILPKFSKIAIVTVCNIVLR